MPDILFQDIPDVLKKVDRLVPLKPKADIARKCSVREAVFIMAENLIAKHEEGCSYKELATFLTDHGIPIKPGTLSRYLHDYRRERNKKSLAELRPEETAPEPADVVCECNSDHTGDVIGVSEMPGNVPEVAVMATANVEPASQPETSATASESEELPEEYSSGPGDVIGASEVSGKVQEVAVMAVANVEPAAQPEMSATASGDVLIASVSESEELPEECSSGPGDVIGTSKMSGQEPMAAEMAETSCGVAGEAATSSGDHNTVLDRQSNPTEGDSQ